MVECSFNLPLIGRNRSLFFFPSFTLLLFFVWYFKSRSYTQKKEQAVWIYYHLSHVICSNQSIFIKKKNYKRVLIDLKFLLPFITHTFCIRDFFFYYIIYSVLKRKWTYHWQQKRDVEPVKQRRDVEKERREKNIIRETDLDPQLPISFHPIKRAPIYLY